MHGYTVILKGWNGTRNKTVFVTALDGGMAASIARRESGYLSVLAVVREDGQECSAAI